MNEFSEPPPPPGTNKLPTTYSANPNPLFPFQHMASSNTEHTGYPGLSRNLFPVNPLDPSSPSVHNLYPHFQTASPHASVHEQSQFAQVVATQCFSVSNNIETRPSNSCNQNIDRTVNGAANSLSQSCDPTQFNTCIPVSELGASDGSFTCPVNPCKLNNPSRIARHDMVNTTRPGENTVDLHSMAQVTADKAIIKQRGDSAENKYSSLSTRSSSDVESAAQEAVLHEQV
ncbi:hypothetical protein KSP40_PGU020746 [Platanthera guangdongensis]|uniref:Uncharacterized protein n=1 Tax=Platanthera guangdongensis TaxID=2320717 RepID=A0ABR2M480_9ASPA